MPSARSSSRSRPSTHAVRRAGRAATRRGAAEFGWTGPEVPCASMSFSYVALQRMQRLAPHVRLVMLIEKSRNWPVLKPVLEDDWLLGPGIDSSLTRHPKFAERLVRTRRDLHLWTVNTREQLDLCLRWGSPGDHRPAAPAGQLAATTSGDRASWHGQKSRTKARERVAATGSAPRTRSGRASPARAGRASATRPVTARAGGVTWSGRSPAWPAERDLVALREFVAAARPHRAGRRPDGAPPARTVAIDERLPELPGYGGPAEAASSRRSPSRWTRRDSPVRASPPPDVGCVGCSGWRRRPAGDADRASRGTGRSSTAGARCWMPRPARLLARHPGFAELSSSRCSGPTGSTYRRGPARGHVHLSWSGRRAVITDRPREASSAASGPRRRCARPGPSWPTNRSRCAERNRLRDGLISLQRFGNVGRGPVVVASPVDIDRAPACPAFTRTRNVRNRA